MRDVLKCCSTWNTIAFVCIAKCEIRFNLVAFVAFISAIVRITNEESVGPEFTMSK